MRDKKYFNHTSPTYGTPFQMMESYGIKYTAAGENIAAGFFNCQDVMEGWLNSPGHKANILNESYTELGLGFVTGGAYGAYWVQVFIRPE